MRGIALWFLVTGVLCAVAGMGYGIVMAVSHDHTLAPAHAHLNLVGWVSMAIFAAYYSFVPVAAASRLAVWHYGLATVGVLLLAPGIALAILGVTEFFAVLGSFASIGSMLMFLFVVLRFREKAAAKQQTSFLGGPMIPSA